MSYKIGDKFTFIKNDENIIGIVSSDIQYIDRNNELYIFVKYEENGYEVQEYMNDKYIIDYIQYNRDRLINSLLNG